MLIRMKETKKGSVDGVTVISYLKGKEYFLSRELASVFLEMGVAEIETPEDNLKELSTPENDIEDLTTPKEVKTETPGKVKLETPKRKKVESPGRKSTVKRRKTKK